MLIIAINLLIYNHFALFCIEKGSFVRIKGLEPPRRKASDPKSDVATNYTISALTVTKVDKKM